MSAKLVERMARGDHEAVGLLYDATARAVYALALRILGDAASAEDVVAEVYLSAWQKAARYDPVRGSPQSWLMVMCRSRAIDMLRERCSESNSRPEPEPAAAVEGPQDLYAAVQRGSRLHACLGQLPAMQRQLLALSFFRGYSHARIAEEMRLPLGSVKTHIRTALRELRHALEEPQTMDRE